MLFTTTWLSMDGWMDGWLFFDIYMCDLTLRDKLSIDDETKNQMQRAALFGAFYNIIIIIIIIIINNHRRKSFKTPKPNITKLTQL